MTKIATPDDLFAVLNTLNIPFTNHTHRAIFTVKEGEDIKHKLPGGHTKNLFLKDKTGKFFLVCALGTTQIAINQLHKVLGCKRLSFGKPDLMGDILGVEPGSVTLFALINDQAHRVQLVLDQALFEHEIVNFHPLRNTATTAFKSQDLGRFLAHTGHTPNIVDFAAL